MQSVLLTSSNFIKGLTNISDNVQDKLLLPALRESQEIDLKQVIGENLLDKLKELIRDNEISKEGNEAYKDLIDKVQYFLAYQTVSRLCVILSFKLDNIGVSRVRDELVEYASMADVTQLEQYYQEKADAYKKQLQNFILDNKKAYPELTECSCNKIKANLYATASSSIFLGGMRGKIRRNRCGGCGK